MRFKSGQKVVCIKEGTWESTITGEVARKPCPKYGEIVTVIRYRPGYPNSIFVTGYESSFVDTRFAPLMDISELTEILNHEPQHA